MRKNETNVNATKVEGGECMHESRRKEMYGVKYATTLVFVGNGHDLQCDAAALYIVKDQFLT